MRLTLTLTVLFSAMGGLTSLASWHRYWSLATDYPIAARHPCMVSLISLVPYFACLIAGMLNKDSNRLVGISACVVSVIMAMFAILEYVTSVDALSRDSDEQTGLGLFALDLIQYFLLTMLMLVWVGASHNQASKE